MPDDKRALFDSLAASSLVSGATFAALVSALRVKDLLSNNDIREIYDHALSLEERQRQSPETDRIYEVAREVIEAQLR